MVGPEKKTSKVAPRSNNVPLLGEQMCLKLYVIITFAYEF